MDLQLLLGQARVVRVGGESQWQQTVVLLQLCPLWIKDLNEMTTTTKKENKKKKKEKKDRRERRRRGGERNEGMEGGRDDRQTRRNHERILF